MDLLLLAAGMGTRLGPRTRSRPKALVPVAGKALIDHVLDRADAMPWVDRVVVVTGSGEPQVRAHLDRRTAGTPVVQVFNPDFDKGNFHSLAAGLEAVPGAFVLMNVDHLYPHRLVAHAHDRARGVSAVCDRDRPLTDDCMKVQSKPGPDGQPRVARIHKQLETHDHGYIGMTFVTAEGRADYLRAVERVRRRGDPKAWAEQVLKALADIAREGGPARAPRIVDASGFGWLEVDDEADLARAEATLAADPSFFERPGPRAVTAGTGSGSESAREADRS